MTREPEWDDEQRASLLALAEYEAGVCACGFHRSLTMDPALGFTEQSEVCPVCAGAAVADRLRSKADEDTAQILKNRPREPRPSDGRHTYIRQLTADELEQRRKRTRGGAR